MDVSWTDPLLCWNGNIKRCKYENTWGGLGRLQTQGTSCFCSFLLWLRESHFFKGQGERHIQQVLVPLLEVLFSCSCSRQRWLAGEQHKYTAVNISWPCNALNKQQVEFSSESSHARSCSIPSVRTDTHMKRNAHMYRHVNTYARFHTHGSPGPDNEWKRLRFI